MAEEGIAKRRKRCNVPWDWGCLSECYSPIPPPSLRSEKEGWRTAPNAPFCQWWRGEGEIFSHNWCFVCQHTSPNSAPKLPHPIPVVGWRIQLRRECLLMLHSILCALNRRQSPDRRTIPSSIRVGPIEWVSEGCNLVPLSRKLQWSERGSIANGIHRRSILSTWICPCFYYRGRTGRGRDRWRGIDVVPNQASHFRFLILLPPASTFFINDLVFIGILHCLPSI